MRLIIFITIRAIAAIILVVAEPFIPHMADILPETQKPVHLVAGGATRQDSVHAGLTALAGLKNCLNIDYVAIHDAARPLIPADLLGGLIAAIDNSNDGKQINEIIGAGSGFAACRQHQNHRQGQ
jgi:2-C-methyl-D-erythritol 4-phosphate cytidylyltransferase